jgi:hypothetical protein
MFCNSGILSLCSLLDLEESYLQLARRPSPTLSHKNQHPYSMLPADLPPAPNTHIKRIKCPTRNLSFLIKHYNILSMGNLNSYIFSTILEMPTMACHVLNSAYTFNWTHHSSWAQTLTIECLTLQSYRKLIEVWTYKTILHQIFHINF